MPVSPFDIAPLGIDAPVRLFQHYKNAVQAIDDYQAALCAEAAQKRSIGLGVTDQDHPDEAFCLIPDNPVYPPLTIIGGMGPLAGALAFRRACARFQDSRAVVLFQACSIPDRSTVILGEGCPDSHLCHEVALKLAQAIRLAVDLAVSTSQTARCIIACNSAHYFWRLVGNELHETATQVQMISMVESSVNALKRASCKRTLLLTTEGAQVGKVFSEPCRNAGIAFDKPSPTLSRLLMSVIFEGMKSLNERRAIEFGNQFFEAILRTGREYDCILAGCTELPLTIDLLKVSGNPAVAAFLSHIKIVDPLEEALCHA
jgi:aspartate/glutamate racemase